MAEARALTGSRVRPLLVLCAVTVAARLALLLCPGADLSEGGRVMAEEIARGNTAFEIVRGPLLALHEYQQPFWGGHLVIAAIAAPLFALFGTSLFVLRLATLPFALLGTCSVFLVLDRLVGRRAAWIGGAFMALPVPGYLMLACTAQGTHLEASALNLFLVLLWLREREAPGAARVFVLGFGLGFALWFGFLALVPIAVVLIADFLENRTFFLRAPFFVRLAGFALGASPWIRLNFLEQGRGLDVYDQKLGQWFDPSGLVSRASSKFASLVEQDLALSLWLPGSRAGSVGVPAFLLASTIVVLWMLAAWRSRSALASAVRGLRTPHRLSLEETWVLVLALAPLYLAAYLGSRFELGPRDWLQNLRYLMPLWPLLCLGAAAELGRWRARRGGPTAIALCAAFAAGSAARADVHAFGRDLGVPSVSTRRLAGMVAWSQRHNRESLESAVSRLESWPPLERAEFLFTLGKWFRFWSAATSKLGPKDANQRPAVNATRAFMRARVQPEEQVYFDEPAPGEIVDLDEDRATFTSRKARGDL